MNFLLQTVSGMDGSPSTMRVLTALITLAVVGAWAYVSIVKKELQPLSAEQVSIVLGALGLKAYQRGKETPQPPAANPIPTP